MKRPSNVTTYVLLLAIPVLVVLAAIYYQKNHALNSSVDMNLPSLVDQATLNSYPKANRSAVNLEHIAGNIMPPTNSWISGAVLQASPNAIYPMPLTFKPTNTGFEIGLPSINATNNLITGQHTPGIKATVTSATDFSLTRFDKISACFTYVNSKTQLGALTLAEGSPFVFYRAKSPTTITLSDIGTVNDSSTSYLKFTKNNKTYVSAAHDGATIKRSGSVATINLPRNSLVTFYALPSSKDFLLSLSGNELADVTTAYHATTSDSLTTFKYQTANNQPTAFTPMSYSNETSGSPEIGHYDSIYGTMPVKQGNEFTLAAPIITPTGSLDLSRLTQPDKDTLATSLSQDIKSTDINASDSYYSGKQLARAANLLQLSEQLGQTSDSQKLVSILNKAFASHLSSDYFYYDSQLHGLAANTAAFGSQDFNDHHFHYGYFIYAASILAKYDPSFLNKYQKQIDLLVADIASYAQYKSFPKQRYYDAYAQHSWAAGLSPFEDGNNQESSSEAINAWNAVALWGQTTGNQALEGSAGWMLSGEFLAAKQAWRLPQNTLQTPYLKNYTSPVSSLNFGGKRTYNTFFSDEPNTKLGIQLIPMNPVMQQFSKDGQRAQNIINQSISNDNYNVALGDYILMYLALEDPGKARNLVTKQTDIDDGNSKSYLEAWVFSQADNS